jgi:hypothetical protein
MVVSVKGGKLAPAFMRELRGTLERDNDTEQGGLIRRRPPTKGMLDEAAKAGMYRHGEKEYHRLQIRTIEELLAGKAFDTPSSVRPLDWSKQMALPL